MHPLVGCHGGLKAPRAEVDVRSGGVGPGAHGVSPGGRGVVGMEPDPGEVRIQSGPHRGLHGVGRAGGHGGGQPVCLLLRRGDLRLGASQHMGKSAHDGGGQRVRVSRSIVGRSQRGEHGGVGDASDDGLPRLADAFLRAGLFCFVLIGRIHSASSSAMTSIEWAFGSPACRCSGRIPMEDLNPCDLLFFEDFRIRSLQ